MMQEAFEKLMEIQRELKVPKGQYNSFGKYKYRSAEDILEAAKPICHKHKCCLTLSDKVVSIGSRYYVMATATLHHGDDAVQVTAFAREDETKKGMDGSQITGTASSYARKYALNGLFNIDDTKDADTDEYKIQQAHVTKTELKDRDEMITEMKRLAKMRGISEADVLKQGGVPSFESMETSQMESGILWLMTDKYWRK